MKELYLILVISRLFESITSWSYEDQESWPGVCNSGVMQSPIDISTEDAVVDKHGVKLKGPLLFKGLDKVNVTAENNGHTLKWNRVESSLAPTLSGGPLTREYVFMQLHLHWLSEHAIDGVKYPLEIHIVHRRSDLTRQEAVKQKDGLAVLGVLCQVYSESPNSNIALEQIIRDVPNLLQQTNGSTKPAVIDLRRLLSPHPQSYYTYEGSLTTPDCQEGVTWIVMDKPLTISDTHFKQIHKANVGGVENFRSLQPRNRIVYRPLTSCSSIITPGALGFLTALLNCAATNFYSAGWKGYCAVAGLKKKLFGGILKGCSIEVTS